MPASEKDFNCSRLVSARRYEGYSILEMAHKLGIKTSQYCEYETGVYPGPEMMLKILNVFSGWPLAFFFQQDDFYFDNCGTFQCYIVF